MFFGLNKLVVPKGQKFNSRGRKPTGEDKPLNQAPKGRKKKNETNNRDT